MSFEPLFFAGSCGPLYAVHHQPAPTQDLSHAVVFLYPLGQEQVRSHKTLQKLAVDLAKLGFHVLRFDYTGTGDSADAEAWSLQTWTDDARRAVDFVRDKSGATRCSLLGVRLGAGLAAGLDVDVEQLVLWDPIGDGAKHLMELNALHDELCASPLYFRRPRGRRASAGDELCGHRVPRSMQDSLRQFSVAPDPAVQARRTLLIDAERTSSSAPPDQLQPVLGNVTTIELGLRCDWLSLRQLENVLMGQPAANEVVKWFKQQVVDASGA